MTAFAVISHAVDETPLGLLRCGASSLRDCKQNRRSHLCSVQSYRPISLLIAAGVPLDEVQSEAEYGLDFAQKAKFGLVSPFANAQLGLIRTLRGLTSGFGSFDHAEFDEILFERHLDSQSAMVCCWYWIAKLQARFFAGDFVSAVEASVRGPAAPLALAGP